MAVVDIKAAYRSINFSMAHRQFQGFKWYHAGSPAYFTDNCLSFGLRCAPAIFTRFTEFIVRRMQARGFPRVYGYIDDFLVMGTTLEECNKGLLCLLSLLRNLGFYVSWDKVKLPAQVVKYLGIEVDTCKLELRLPCDKLAKAKGLVEQFMGFTHANKCQILSLAGYLSHCSQVVRGGRTFSRRIINLANYLSELSSVIRLPSWFKDDLLWWGKFMRCFNGKAAITRALVGEEPIIWTDLSMSGFGGWMACDWFVGFWQVPDHRRHPFLLPSHVELAPSELESLEDINTLELWPVLCSISRWVSRSETVR